jgi:hypothetical protein
MTCSNYRFAVFRTIQDNCFKEVAGDEVSRKQKGIAEKAALGPS